MRPMICLSCAGWLALRLAVAAQEVQILSLSQNGILTWTNSSLNVTCRVEWAPTVNGPWCSSWASLTNIVVTNAVVQCAVPMFYRVVALIPPPQQLITNLTPADALQLLASHVGDTNFVVLDVRTPTEYGARHIRHAVNLDYYGTTFRAELSQLDKQKTYLVYCGSGSRSGKATEIMRGLGFSRVYNMLYGLGSFAVLSGASAWLEGPN